ncbi:hypothetical protein PoB_003442700 [Plakobranchus ocellatus]|uniref:Uncharacterized protein n=1 Tax=Plakobranchus ocellatus TaxID=259542 RepID=A0AAV4ALQ8_9GAST|nr:hypothetical protein PoB_003442700 [Plakobranchus ocellatus]
MLSLNKHGTKHSELSPLHRPELSAVGGVALWRLENQAKEQTENWIIIKIKQVQPSSYFIRIWSCLTNSLSAVTSAVYHHHSRVQPDLQTGHVRPQLVGDAHRGWFRLTIVLRCDLSFGAPGNKYLLLIGRRKSGTKWRKAAAPEGRVSYLEVRMSGLSSKKVLVLFQHRKGSLTRKRKGEEWMELEKVGKGGWVGKVGVNYRAPPEICGNVIISAGCWKGVV